MCEGERAGPVPCRAVPGTVPCPVPYSSGGAKALRSLPWENGSYGSSRRWPRSPRLSGTGGQGKIWQRGAEERARPAWGIGGFPAAWGGGAGASFWAGQRGSGRAAGEREGGGSREARLPSPSFGWSKPPDPFPSAGAAVLMAMLLADVIACSALCAHLLSEPM